VRDDTTLDHKDFIKVLARGKWTIFLMTIIITLAVGAISYYFMKINTSIYQTSTSVIVGKKADIVQAKDSIDTYKEIASSNNVAKSASLLLKGTISPADIQKAYVVTDTAGDPILKFVSSADTPQKSLDISNAVTGAFALQVKGIYPDETLENMESSVQTTATVTKDFVRNVALGFLLGLFLSIFIVTFRGYFDTKIRTKDEIERYLDLPVIGNLSRRRKRLI